MTTKKSIIIGLFLLISNSSYSQCLSGDCHNGNGQYDYAYAIYTGSFLNGQAHGQGSMDYGKGEKYVGEFSNGLENGKGLLFHKDGTSEEVKYKNGAIVKKMVINFIGGVLVDGCKVGDCTDGYGEIDFESGNQYKGYFKNGFMHGKGKFQFVRGNVFEGELFENNPQKGKFTYSEKSVEFNGYFNSDGTPKSGIYYYPENESTVTIQDNVIVEVYNKKSEAIETDKNVSYTKCPACNGEGIVGSSSTYSYTTQGTYTMSQFGQGRINITNPTTHTSQGRTFYNVCDKCKGAKKVPVK